MSTEFKRVGLQDLVYHSRNHSLDDVSKITIIGAENQASRKNVFLVTRGSLEDDICQSKLEESQKRKSRVLTRKGSPSLDSNAETMNSTFTKSSLWKKMPKYSEGKSAEKKTKLKLSPALNAPSVSTRMSAKKESLGQKSKDSQQSIDKSISGAWRTISKFGDSGNTLVKKLQRTDETSQTSNSLDRFAYLRSTDHSKPKGASRELRSRPASHMDTLRTQNHISIDGMEETIRLSSDQVIPTLFDQDLPAGKNKDSIKSNMTKIVERNIRTLQQSTLHSRKPNSMLSNQSKAIQKVEFKPYVMKRMKEIEEAKIYLKMQGLDVQQLPEAFKSEYEKHKEMDAGNNSKNFKLAPFWSAKNDDGLELLTKDKEMNLLNQYSLKVTWKS